MTKVELSCLMVIAIAFGVAVQNSVTAIALLATFVTFWRQKLKLSQIEPTALGAFGFLAVIIVSTSISPAGRATQAIPCAAGYLGWALFGSFGFIKPQASEQWGRLSKTTFCVLILWGAIIASQRIFGWYIEGGHEIHTGIYRTRGFYSHPMSLAYVSLILWPLALHALFAGLNKWQPWLMLSIVAGIVWTSESRVVQAVLFAYTLVKIFMHFHGRQRLLIFGGLVVVIGIGFSFDKQLTRKYGQMMSGAAVQESGYPDDRLAFWNANFRLFTERPLLGHGASLPDGYRDRVYEEIGLGEMQKKYQAHNMFLDVMVCEGLLGLALFLLWYGAVLRSLWRARTENPFALILFETLVVFAVAGLTQNSFQDNVVRYVLSVLFFVYHVVPSTVMRTSFDSPAIPLN